VSSKPAGFRTEGEGEIEAVDTPALIASRIRDAIGIGRICGLVGRGCADRVARVARLVKAGGIDPYTGLRLAREVEALALCFAPLPEPAP
jgi:hypothetical protein